MTTSDILNVLDRLNIKYSAERVDGRSIEGYSSLFHYKLDTMTFIASEAKFSNYADQLPEIDYSLILIGNNEKLYDCFKNVIRVVDTRETFFRIIEECFEKEMDEKITGISSDPGFYQKHSYISPKATIGRNVKIGVGCVIEGNVVIGDDTEIHHNVVIRNKTKIGSRCTIHSGVIIGENGFGYIVGPNGEKNMLKHFGGVRIEDDVHIGDNSIIIRGAIDDTIISKGVKINTLAHIAHNDFVGEDTIITSPVHICGSVSIGKQCHIAGATIRNQRSVGDYSTVGLGAVVINNIPDHTVVVGNPAKKLEK